MDVFISWSGEASKELAESLADWLKTSLQETEPFLSSEDIRYGQRWESEIGKRLEQTSVSLLALTPESRDLIILRNSIYAGACPKPFDCIVWGRQLPPYRGTPANGIECPSNVFECYGRGAMGLLPASQASRAPM